MYKLDHIRRELNINPEISIVRAREPEVSLDMEFEYCVAPSTGGVYTVARLQDMMLSLIPGLQPTSVNDFREEHGQIWFGSLFFSEKYGEETTRRETVLTDEDILSSHGFRNGFDNGRRVHEETAELHRWIIVHLYPNGEIARDIRYHTAISRRRLAKYRSYSGRILGLSRGL